MIVTTTPGVDGYRIVQYLAPIACNIVAGTNLLEDIYAGISDVFGGRSQTYQRQLSDMYDDAIGELKTKASKLGANCVVGARFDFGQIAGKGMQMFMLSAVATPVVIKTDLEISQEADAAALVEVERKKREADRREHFAASSNSLLSLLADPEIAREVGHMRRLYGRDAALDLLKRKGADLGLDRIDLTADDLPDTI